MDFNLIDFILHIDDHLLELVKQFGTKIYYIIFLIVYCETGLVVTPFLPGDSLLFAAGAVAQSANLNLWILYFGIVLAALLGDNTNYFIGKLLGDRIYEKDSRWIKRSYIDKTKVYYEKWGAMTIIMGRFMPIVRTFVPFVAGVGKMSYPKFLSYSIASAFLWVSVFLVPGYYFGGLPFVKQNFSIITIAIIIVSVMPALIKVYMERRKAKQVQ